MQKNWYAVYTKPKCEKKLASLLSKWKIDNFCPLNCVSSNVSWRGKTLCEPLFKSYVFVNISEDQIGRLLKVECIVNFLHWLGKPAIIKNDEIEALKEFTNDYSSIKLEKGMVNTSECSQIIDEPSYRIEGKFISVKSEKVKLTLPSLGFTLIAEIEKDGILERQNSLLRNQMPVQEFKTA